MSDCRICENGGFVITKVDLGTGLRWDVDGIWG